MPIQVLIGTSHLWTVVLLRHSGKLSAACISTERAGRKGGSTDDKRCLADRLQRLPILSI